VGGIPSSFGLIPARGGKVYKLIYNRKPQRLRKSIGPTCQLEENEYAEKLHWAVVPTPLVGRRRA